MSKTVKKNVLYKNLYFRLSACDSLILLWFSYDSECKKAFNSRENFFSEYFIMCIIDMLIFREKKDSLINITHYLFI